MTSRDSTSTDTARSMHVFLRRNATQSLIFLAMTIIALSSSSSLLVAAQEAPSGLELCPTACACPVPAPTDGGQGAAAPGGSTAEAGSGIVVTRQKCDPTDVETCRANCNSIHGVDSYLSDKCCIHAGQSASLLAFEESDMWVPRIEEFNRCTGAQVRLEYLPEGEDGMADALRADLGDDSDVEQMGGNGGQGIFDAYIVQAPWLPPVVDGLENLTPLIRENADTVKFLDINPASRSAVSFNGTVRALPLDLDYIAIGWRQDVFYKHNVPPELSPPRTVQDLADLAEMLNGLDHNNDGEGDWGICLTPQVNYFYAFVAPILQTALRDPKTGTQTGQNMFFDSDTFEPLIRVPGFRSALELYWRIIRASNCQDQLVNGEKCDRKTAFPTGRCAMVLSMPGTLTNMLRNGGKYAPRPRTNENTGEVVWDVSDMPLGDGGTYWGRRAPMPGSSIVQDWSAEGYPLVSCQDSGGACPLADADGINCAPFFSEGGEAYTLNGRQSKPAARAIMWDMFTWLSELPVTELPLSGQYRKSHLGEEHRENLINNAGWPEQMVDDIFDVLGEYFLSEEEGGNPVQDLLMLGFPDYMGALNEELHDKFLGVSKDATGGLFNRADPSKSISPDRDAAAFDDAFNTFVDNLESRYNAISDNISGGPLGQLQRWRQSLNLPWRTDKELCTAALSTNVASFRRLQCPSVVDLAALCQTQPEDVAKFDENVCTTIYSSSDGNNAAVVATAIIIPVVAIIFAGTVIWLYLEWKRRHADAIWMIHKAELKFDDPPEIAGRGTFGLVVKAEYRGTDVAVKRVIPPKDRISRPVISLPLRRNSAVTFAFDDGKLSRRDSGDKEKDKAARRTSDDSASRKSSLDDLSRRGSMDHIFDEEEANGSSNDLEACDRTMALSKKSSSWQSNMSSTNSDEKGTNSSNYTSSSYSSGMSSSQKVAFKRWFGYKSSKPNGGKNYGRLKKEFVAEMRILSRLRHPCVVTVMGSVVDTREEPLLVMEYMENGSVYDLLHNASIVIDGELIFPILQDIVRGARFLHAADPAIIHGDLKAANVLVDARFRAKIADFGLSAKKYVGATGTPFWMAPELLSGESTNTAESDVYSFGIILYELYSRKDPYEGEDSTEVLKLIVDERVSKRPPVPVGCPPKVAEIMSECLERNPEKRPTFEEIDLRLKRLSVENVEPAEMHLSHQARKNIKAQRGEELISKMFPKHIADQLREGRKPEPEKKDMVTTFFSDIVGFTNLSSKLPDEKVSDMLDRLYLRFDALADKHDVFKIETIGDAFIGVTNLIKDQDDHTMRIAQFAIDCIEAARKTPISLDDPTMGHVIIRVGFHSGPAVASVVGSRLPKYTVLGDSVNTAARMETSSLPGRIQCTEQSARLLAKQCPAIPIALRGEISIKGKGEMVTYWVNEVSSSSRRHLPPSTDDSKGNVRRSPPRATKEMAPEEAQDPLKAAAPQDHDIEAQD